jgi:hypothetical protein
MKKIIVLFTLIVCFQSCNKDEVKGIVEREIELHVITGSGGGLVCGEEYCGITVELEGYNGAFKATEELSNEIKEKYEFWNKTYIATVKILEGEICTCKDGDVDPMPGANPAFPTNTYPIIEILSIREK